jgi:uncharacterized protein (DUF58 family)
MALERRWFGFGKAGGARPTNGVRGWFANRARPERIRITRVGLWYVLVALVVGIAATNTGNNALYLVLAAMLGLLVVSGVISRSNVRGLEFRLDAPGEIYARRPLEVGYTLDNRGWLPRYLLLFTLGAGIAPRLVNSVRRGESRTGRFELLFTRRGRHVLQAVHVASLFPLGYYQKGMRYPLESELMVFPEIFPAASRAPQRRRDGGEGSRPRPGWGHELHALRAFRRGDDPRGIHWKQTARTGRMVYLEREAEEGRRLSIVLDNRARTLDEATIDRFEHLVSEAATAAVDHLERGFEVEVVLCGERIGFAGGERQRLRILRTLAVIEPKTAGGQLGVPAGNSELRLALDPELAA